MGIFRIKPNDPYLDFFKNQNEDILSGDPYQSIPQETLDLRASQPIEEEPDFWTNLGKSFGPKSPDESLPDNRFAEQANQSVGEFGSFLKNAVLHPIDTAKSVIESPFHSALSGVDQLIGGLNGAPAGMPAEAGPYVRQFAPEMVPGGAEGLEAGLKVGLPIASPGSEILAKPLSNLAKGDIQGGAAELAVLGLGGALLHKAGGGLVEGLKEIPKLAEKHVGSLPFEYSSDPGMFGGDIKLKKYRKDIYQGQEVKILGRRGNSVKIELPDGTSKTVGFSSLGEKKVNQLEVPKGKYEDIVKELETLSGEGETGQPKVGDVINYNKSGSSIINTRNNDPSITGGSAKVGQGKVVGTKIDPTTGDTFLQVRHSAGEEFVHPTEIISNPETQTSQVSIGTDVDYGSGMGSDELGVYTPSRSFKQNQSPISLPVKVTFPDGQVHYDVIKGFGKDDALAKAADNWEGAKVEESTLDEVNADVSRSKTETANLTDNPKYGLHQSFILPEVMSAESVPIESPVKSLKASPEKIAFAKEDVSSQPHIIDQLSDLEKSFGGDETPTIDPSDVSIVLPDKNIIPEYASFNKVGRPGKQGPPKPPRSRSSVPPKPPIEPPNTGGGNDGGGGGEGKPLIDPLGQGKKPSTGGEWLLDLFRVPAALKASGDIPALSHARYDTLAHPIDAMKRLKTAGKAVFSPAEQERVFKEISDDPMFQDSLKAGIQYTKQGYDLGAQSFGSYTAEHSLGPISEVVKGSERGQNVYLDKARMDRFKKLMEDAGIKNFDQDPKSAKEIAKLANVSTGYGKLDSVSGENTVRALNTVMWSARKRLARAQHLKMLGEAVNPASEMSPTVRKEIFRQAVPTIAIGLSLLKLAQDQGAKVDWDPRNSNFMKARFPTESDKYIAWGPFGDYTGLIKLASQELSGTKSTDKGEYDLDDPKGPFAPTRKSLVQDYMYNSLNPSARGIWDSLDPNTESADSPFLDVDEHPSLSKGLEGITPINVSNEKQLYDELGPVSSLFAPFITAGENIDVYDPDRFTKQKERLREEKGLPPKQSRKKGKRKGKVLSTY